MVLKQGKYLFTIQFVVSSLFFKNIHAFEPNKNNTFGGGMASVVKALVPLIEFAIDSV